MGSIFKPALGLLGLALFTASGAMAQSVFVIQLGSFPSKQEAEQKWESLQKSQPDVVGGLSMHVAEAILQPDNVTLYRTQAGPFKNKIDAQTACGKLKSTKTECFVVETAMFVPSTPPSQQVAAKAPEPLSLPSLSTAQPEAKAALAPLPLPPELPTAGGENNVTVAAASPSANESNVSPAIKQEKITTVATTETEVKTASAPEKKKGWFSWVRNPFASKKEETTKEETKTTIVQSPAPVSSSSTITAAPVTSVQQAQTQPVAPSSTRGQTIFYGSANDKSHLRPWAPSTHRGLTAPPPAPAASAENMPTVSAASAMGAAAKAQPRPLPPVSSAMAEPVAPPAPSAPVSMPQALPATQFPATPGAKPITIRARENAVAEAPPVKAVPSGDAKVKVAEAIRVPLSTHKRLVTSANPASFKSMPSQNLGLRSYWAQLSYFADERNALDFWQSFSGSQPELANMRVRLIRPYLTRGRAVKTSLRVGPFENADGINRLCGVASSRGLRCYAVADMGSSTIANVPRNREAVPLKYQAAHAEAETGPAGYWVQLGTYRSASEAEGMWDQLKDSNSDLLKRTGSKVSVPTFSSSPQAKYRLRAGPFSNEIAASNLCRKLKFRNVGCLVVSGQ